MFCAYKIILYIKREHWTQRLSFYFKEIKIKINTTFKNVTNYLEQGKISNALKEILILIDYSNKFFNITEPWKIVNEDKSKCEELCYNYLTLIANICILLNPFIPTGTKKLAHFIGIKINNYNFYELNSINLQDFYPLYARITN